MLLLDAVQNDIPSCHQRCPHSFFLWGCDGFPTIIQIVFQTLLSLWQTCLKEKEGLPVSSSVLVPSAPNSPKKAEQAFSERDIAHDFS